MSQDFDPYYTWLGIPPEEQPADHYRLLGIRRFENNDEVIANALLQRQTHIRSFEQGPRAEAAQRLLQELATANDCLSHVEQKGAYDRVLRNKDAPKLMKAGGRRPSRPDAPRRVPAASYDPLDPLTSVTVQPLAAPMYGDPLANYPPVGYAPAGQGTYPQVARGNSSPFRGPLLVAAVVGLPLLFLFAVVLGLAIWGGSMLLAKLPGGVRGIGTVSRSGNQVTFRGVDATGATGAGRVLTLDLGEPVDLLAKFAPRGQSPRGSSSAKDASGWTTSGRADYEVFRFPGNLPPEYVVETKVTLLEKSQGVIQQLVSAGKPFHVTVDGFDGETDGRGIRTALEMIDGRRPQHIPDYPGETLGSVLKLNRPSEVRYYVLKDKVLVECDGRLVLVWTEMSRVSTNWMFAQGNPNQLAWGTLQTKCQLSKFVVTPILGQESDFAPEKPGGLKLNKNTATSDAPTTRIVVTGKTAASRTKPQVPPAGELWLIVDDTRDLLAGFDPQLHCKPAGCMVRDRNGWVPRRQSTYEAMYFSGEIPEEYVLETTLTLQSRSLGIVQGLVAGRKQCHVTVDGFERNDRGMKTTLEQIDGRTPHDLVNYPCEKLGTLLTRERPAELRYVVLKNRILVECDGQVVLDWTGGLNRVSTNRNFVAGNEQSLYWGTWQTKCRLSRFVVRPILEVK